MPHNHRRYYYYWLFVISLLCLSTHITQCNDEEDVEDGPKGEDEGSYWSTFASVAGQVASSAGDSVYSAATTGATTISEMFSDDDDKEEETCDEDGCVENETSVENPRGIFTTVTNTVSNAWSSTKEATGAALDGVRNSIAGEVDAILGAVGNRIATALTPG